MKEGKRFLLILSGAVVLILLVYFLIVYVLPGQSSLAEPLAKCLQSKNVTMYGAYWCSHCQNEKKMFGQYFSYINYVECEGASGNPEVCMAAGVQGYPTWKINGNTYSGEKSLLELKELSGC